MRIRVGLIAIESLQNEPETDDAKSADDMSGKLCLGMKLKHSSIIITGRQCGRAAKIYFFPKNIMNIRWVHGVHGKNAVLAANHAEFAFRVHEIGQVLIKIKNNIFLCRIIKIKYFLLSKKEFSLNYCLY